MLSKNYGYDMFLKEGKNIIGKINKNTKERNDDYEINMNLIKENKGLFSVIIKY